MGSEDMIFNGLIRNAMPLALGEWQGKTGVSEPQPRHPWVWDEWARRVQIRPEETRSIFCLKRSCVRRPWPVGRLCVVRLAKLGSDGGGDHHRRAAALDPGLGFHPLLVRAEALLPEVRQPWTRRVGLHRSSKAPASRVEAGAWTRWGNGFTGSFGSSAA
jgi:hypothetical protein